MTVQDKKTGARLEVLEVVEMNDGSLGYLVCKAGCPNPKMGQFRVRQDQTKPLFQ